MLGGASKIASLADLAGPSGLVTDGDWVESKDQDPNGEVRLIQLADVGDGLFLDRSRRFLTLKKAKELRCTFLQPGDILIARMPDPLGRACIFPGLGRPAVTAVDVLVWRGDDAGADARWLMHAVNSPAVRTEIASLASGTTRQRVSGGNLKRLQLRIVPSSEQKRVAAKLDSLLAHVKKVREELARVPQLVERYKQAVLAAAFRGDLTTHWRSQVRPGPVKRLTIEEEPWSIPTLWVWQRVIDIGAVGLGRQRSPINHNGPYMRPYVRAANITWTGWDFSDVKEMNFDPSDFARFRLYPGDVLINEGSGSAKEVGKPAIWHGEIEDCCFQNTLIRVRPQDCIPEYIYYYFLFNALTERFVSKTQGINIFHIGKDGLAGYPIPLPSIEEQKEVVVRLETAFSKIKRFDAERSRAETLCERLTEAILGKAFRGVIARVQ